MTCIHGLERPAAAPFSSSRHRCGRRALAAALLAATGSAACSNGGGGSGDAILPVLVTAAFGGAGPGPVAGDLLLLSFSEDMRSAVGATVTDTDLALSGGGTLGAGTTVLDQPTPRSARLSLGTGVAFTPGTTTAVLVSTNVVFADLVGNLGDSGAPITIDASDGFAPTLGNLTLNAIDDALNGTGPAGGLLQVPQNGWIMDLAYTDLGVGVDPARTLIQASLAVTASGISQPPGTNLLPFLTVQSATPTAASYLVPASLVFPAGPVTLTAVVVDAGGLPSAAVAMGCTVKPWTDALRPFETTVNPSQVWYLDLSRDIESFTTTTFPGGASIGIVDGASGRSDFLDILHVLGLQAATPQPNVSGSDDSNVVVQNLFRAALLAELSGFFTGANIGFTFTQPAGSFGGNTSLPYASIGFSRICIAGAADAPGILGVAQFDPNNQRQNDDCLLQAGNTVRLGVFLHTIADSGLQSPSSSTFRFVFNNFAPAVGGVPIGMAVDMLDGGRLTNIVNDVRAARIDDAIGDLARFTAVVIAHECGHSMGLVQNGAMPVGLYGNDAINFPGSNSGHIRTQALFPTGTNIMSPVLGYTLALDPATGFNRLNLAYLREQVSYGN